MERLSRRAYARRIGVSEKAVRKAIAEGRITVESDGKIDPVKADKQWSENTRAGGHAVLPMTPAVEATAPAPAATGSKGQATNGKSNSTKGKPESAALEERARQQAARTEDLSGRAVLTRLKVGQLEGRLVEREKAEAYVFEKMRMVRDSWMAFPSRVAPMMAADLEIEDVRGLQRSLDQYVQQHLEEMANTEPEGFEIE